MSSRPGLSKTAALYACGIFVSASLLFMVQPMVARMLLPRLGGTSAVWTTCMLFFQVLLLGGYLYAHVLAKRLPPRPQLGLHLLLAASCAVFLPLSIRDGAPAADAMPIGWLLVTLLGAVGLPFFVLSTTSPLLQSWFSKTNDPLSHNPYPLYAASNVGSMASLLGYPFLIEPMLTLKHQTWLWSGGFALFFAFLIACALVLAQRGGLASTTTQAETSEDSTDEPAPTTKEIARWIGLAFVPSSLLLGVTTHITTDVAPMPLLWIVPLALYLLSFILVFSNWTQTHQLIVQLASAALVLPALAFLIVKPALPAELVLGLYLLLFTLMTLAFHGQMAAERPAAKHLTLFFLCMSIGGALGGLFNGLFAPLVFDRSIEFFLILSAAALALAGPLGAFAARSRRARGAMCAVALVVCVAVLNTTLNTEQEQDFVWASVVVSALAACGLVWAPRVGWGMLVGVVVLARIAMWQDPNTVHRQRSFFSTHAVIDIPALHLRNIMHGTTSHGTQSTGALRGQPLSYYHPAGPVGQALQTLALPAAPRYAMVGLGAGALATYCRQGATCDMFEIDPVVVEIAREHFTYLKDCGEACHVEIGDGRLLVEAKPDATYDIIFLDAYNSDSVPIHLITKEALAIYANKLKPGGTLLFHLSNRYLDLRPVLATLAKDAGMRAAVQVFFAPPEAKNTFAADAVWAVLSPSHAQIEALLVDPRWRPLVSLPGEPLWTDDFSNILPVIARGGPRRPRAEQ